jgi:hypothetical protein
MGWFPRHAAGVRGFGIYNIVTGSFGVMPAHASSVAAKEHVVKLQFFFASRPENSPHRRNP